MTRTYQDVCRNPRCQDWLPRTQSRILCPSCWLMLRLGVAGGSVLAGLIGFLWGLRGLFS